MKWFLFKIFFFVLCLISTPKVFASHPEMISRVNIHYLCQNIFHPEVRTKYFDKFTSEASKIIHYPKNNLFLTKKILDHFQQLHQPLDPKLSRNIMGLAEKIQNHPNLYKVSTLKVEGEEEINEFFTAWHLSVRSRLTEEFKQIAHQAELDRRLFYWNRTTSRDSIFKTSVAASIGASVVASLILLQPDYSLQLKTLTLAGFGVTEAFSIGYIVGYIREYLKYFNTQVDRGFDKQYVYSGDPIVLDQKYFDSLLTKKFISEFHNPSTLTHSFDEANKFVYSHIQEVSPDHVVFLLLSFKFNLESQRPELKIHYIHRNGL